MRTFVFHGQNPIGKIINGEIDASNEVEARIKLRAQKINPIKISEKGAPSAVQTGSFDVLKRFGVTPKVKAKDLQVFTRQFATMISSGIPIVQSLEILRIQSSSPILREAVFRVKSQVESGKRLADSMESYPTVFNHLYVSMVRAGEEAGALDTILNRLAQYIEKSVKIRNKITGALWYPMLVMLLAFVVMGVILVYVIPKFENLFKSVGAELPLPTQYVIALSHFMVGNMLLILLGLGVLIFSLVRYYATAAGRFQLDMMLLEIPILGDLIQKGSIARFARTLSTMLSSGVGIMDGLDISANVVDNAVMERAIMRAKKGVAEGKTIVQPFMTERSIPPMLTQMIGVGEASGSLDTLLSKAADFYEEEVDYAVESMTSVLGPILVVFLGGLVGMLLIAMYLPIFNLSAVMVK